MRAMPPSPMFEIAEELALFDELGELADLPDSDIASEIEELDILVLAQAQQKKIDDEAWILETFQILEFLDEDAGLEEDEESIEELLHELEELDEAELLSS